VSVEFWRSGYHPKKPNQRSSAASLVEYWTISVGPWFESRPG
ncbi:hypothetical protein AVEN_151010-1, partial [Araneus ventricosus]